MPLKCYYAHSLITYNSEIEVEDVELLNELGFQVINPNTPELQEECQENIYLENNDSVMEFFENVISNCNVLAFRSFRDGRIDSKVAAEIDAAYRSELPVIELPQNPESRYLSYNNSKPYLH